MKSGYVKILNDEKLGIANLKIKYKTKWKLQFLRLPKWDETNTCLALEIYDSEHDAEKNKIKQYFMIDNDAELSKCSIHGEEQCLTLAGQTNLTIAFTNWNDLIEWHTYLQNIISGMKKLKKKYKIRAESDIPADSDVTSFDMESNNIYFGNNECERFSGVRIIESPSDQNLNTFDEYNIEIWSGGITLFHSNETKPLITWPYSVLRRYGSSNNRFSVETGRMSESGEGTYVFKSNSSKLIIKHMKRLSSKGIIPKDEQSSIVNSISSISIDDHTTNKDSMYIKSIHMPHNDIQLKDNSSTISMYSTANINSRSDRDSRTLPSSMQLNQSIEIKNEFLNQPLHNKYNNQSKDDNAISCSGENFDKSFVYSDNTFIINNEFKSSENKQNQSSHLDDNSDMSDDNEGDDSKGAPIIRSTHSLGGNSNYTLFKKSNETDSNHTRFVSDGGYQNVQNFQSIQAHLEKRAITHKYENTRPRCESEPADPNIIFQYTQAKPITTPIFDGYIGDHTHLPNDRGVKSQYEINSLDETLRDKSNTESNQESHNQKPIQNERTPGYINVQIKNKDIIRSQSDSNKKVYSCNTTNNYYINETNTNSFERRANSDMNYPNKPLPPLPIRHPYIDHSKNSHAQVSSQQTPLYNNIQPNLRTSTGNNYPIPTPNLIHSNMTDAHLHDYRIPQENFNKDSAISTRDIQTMQNPSNNHYSPQNLEVMSHSCETKSMTNFSNQNFTQPSVPNYLTILPDNIKPQPNFNTKLTMQDDRSFGSHSSSSSYNERLNDNKTNSSLSLEASKSNSESHNYLTILPDKMQPTSSDASKSNSAHHNYLTILPDKMQPTSSEYFGDRSPGFYENNMTIDINTNRLSKNNMSLEGNDYGHYTTEIRSESSHFLPDKSVYDVGSAQNPDYENLKGIIGDNQCKQQLWHNIPPNTSIYNPNSSQIQYNLQNSHPNDSGKEFTQYEADSGYNRN